MKKVISIIIAFAAIVTIQAANTEVARLTLTGKGSAASSDVTVRVDPSVSVAETSSFFKDTEYDELVNIYVRLGAADDQKFSSYKRNDVSSLPIAFITNRTAASNQHYTITFNVPTRTEGLKLFDSHAEQVVDIIHGATYEFDVNTTLEPGYVEGTNYEVVDRFFINVPLDTDPLETCFTGTELQIKSNPYYGKITVKTSGGSTVKQYAYGTSSIDFNEKSAGDYIYTDATEYTVSFGGSRSFIVKVKR